jgi:hypothetical protein
MVASCQVRHAMETSFVVKKRDDNFAGSESTFVGISRFVLMGRTRVAVSALAAVVLSNN